MAHTGVKSYSLRLNHGFFPDRSQKVANLANLALAEDHKRFSENLEGLERVKKGMQLYQVAEFVSRKDGLETPVGDVIYADLNPDREGSQSLWGKSETASSQ